jgi:hypothetical protein
MNDQELKNLWQGQKPSGKPALTADEQIAAMRKKMAKMHRGLNTLDFWGLAANASVLIVFTIYFFTTPHFVIRIGALIIIGGDLFASWKLIQRRRSTLEPIADAPVIEWLKYDLAMVHQHAEENRTVLWWSVLPFLIGTIAFLWSMPASFSIKIGPSVLIALIAAVTYWLNQRARRKQWLPLQQELEALLHFDKPVSQLEPPKKNIMTKTILIGIVLISLGAIVFVRGSGPKTPAIEYSDDPASVEHLLQLMRESGFKEPTKLGTLAAVLQVLPHETRRNLILEETTSFFRCRGCMVPKGLETLPTSWLKALPGALWSLRKPHWTHLPFMICELAVADGLLLVRFAQEPLRRPEGAVNSYDHVRISLNAALFPSRFRPLKRRHGQQVRLRNPDPGTPSQLGM